MSNFVEITSNDNWFKQHPEKIAGVEYETTSFYFPIMVKGTKEDVLRVTGMSVSNSKQKVLERVHPKLMISPFISYYENMGYLVTTRLANDGFTEILGIKKDYTLDEILNDDLIGGEVEREDAELKKAGWSRKDIQGVADFVTNKAKEKKITVSVLRYKSNGNDLIDTKKTIDAIEGIDNAFTIKDSDGGYFLVLKLTNNNKTIYFEEGSYSERSINEDITQQLVNKLIERVTNNLKDTETVRYVSKLSLEVAKELGYDFEKLQKIRDLFLKQKSENEVIFKQQKEQQEKQKAIDKATNELKDAIKTFTEFAFGNGYIHYDDLEILIKENNLEKPHIRTIGSLRKRNVNFKNQGNSYSYSGKTRYNISTDDSIFNAIDQLKEIYKNGNPDKEKRIRIANANAKARIKILEMGQLGASVVMNSEDIKLMIPFNKQIVNAMKKGYAPDKIFHLGKPFGELAKHIPDYKIEMTGKVLTKSMSKDKDHQLNWANFIDLPFFLNNPTAIFKSETIGYVVLTEVYDVNNKPVMISLHINKKYFITNIASLYVRNYNTYKRWINENLHLYINEKSDLFDGTQATIAVGSNKSQYKDIKK